MPFIYVLFQTIAVEREKRMSPARNLTLTPLPGGGCRLCWDRPLVPPLFYRVTFTAITISNGTVSVTYKSVLLPGSENCIDLPSADKNNINIFLVNAIYASSVHSALFLNGKQLTILKHYLMFKLECTIVTDFVHLTYQI